MLSRVVAVVCLSMLLAACGGLPSAGPAPDAGRGGMAPRWHTVQAGETLGSLARRYGVSVRALAAANNLHPPYVIRIGQRLSLPQGATSPGRTYVVRPGDTLSTIAARFNTTVPALAAASAIDDPNRIVAGQVLRLPPPGAAPRRTATPPRPPVASGPALLIPVQGTIAAGFAEAGGGLEIAAAPRAPVYAAADGVVLYAGPGPNGVGGIVLLRHDDGRIGVYARAGEVLVARDERVRRGTMIARLPDHHQPRLRFELREDGRQIDPTPRLTARQAEHAAEPAPRRFR